MVEGKSKDERRMSEGIRRETYGQYRRWRIENGEWKAENRGQRQ
jgi:hypothetical protein